MTPLSRSEAQALVDRHLGDGRVACQCLRCLWARETLAQWKALEAAKTLKIVA
jgi:hypothetical protein